ncbi:hypothetical protein KSP35_22720 [Aquihabitans sp. G128]|uniref:GDSL-type esterase/lipase family protein n=1 Tax=Aquihabitans sp. G128 TaxID=2849779 RepID=UPI001C23D985|nr:GDSL-type esterase/lipase family protein [Aquihabitans sp. G128]QXC61091.1 hypothetical protein KSP35_22720 [Aquihabitans sp. G128]
MATAAMTDVAIDGPAVDLVGALDLEETPDGLVPRRLPAWTRPQIPDLFMEAMVKMPSGVRLRFATDATEVELDVHVTHIRPLPLPLRPSVFDLLVDGRLAAQVPTTVGTVISIDALDPSASITFDEGPATTVRFDGLAAGTKVLELWLPQGSSVELRGLRVTAGATVDAAPEDERPRWIHYGSSISHCMEADSPTGTWPAVAAAAAGLDLRSVAFAGQCQLDQFVARTIRDLPADVITLKVGINVVNGNTLNERAFSPAVHGFLDTVRDGHPDTPIVVVSPIFCPSAEDHPGPTVPDADRKFVTVPGLEDLRATSLTLVRLRRALSEIVALRIGLGDENLRYLDGLGLFGPDDAGDLPDDLHPNAAGYRRMGARFAEQVFAEGGVLGPISRSTEA